LRPRDDEVSVRAKHHPARPGELCPTLEEPVCLVSPEELEIETLARDLADILKRTLRI
jgi:hypothetical protein